MKSQCTRSFQLIFICFVVALFYLNKIDARSHKRRSPASNLDSYTKLDQLDTSSSAPTRRRQHHRRKHSKFHNITEQDLQHRPEVRLQLSNDYSERCRLGQLSSEEMQIKWLRNDCEHCSCTDNYQVLCQKTNCPELTCDHPVHVEGECCRMCPEKLCRTDDGRYFKHGADWHLDDCTSCECLHGDKKCSVEDCEWKSCPNAIKVPGKCCPICPDSSCLSDNGENQTAGAVWSEGFCTNCYCRKGERICADEKCPHINCTNPFRSPESCCYKCEDAVECVLSQWNSWGECPIQECGGGLRRRYRTILIAPKNGGAFCPHMSEAQLCPQTPCDDLPVCPVTEWSSWSHCTATCGNGKRLRMREHTKVTKALMTSLIDCSTTHLQESMSCYTGTCQLSYVPKNIGVVDLTNGVHCADAVWMDWSPCSTTCGPGVKTRVQKRSFLTETNETCHLLTELSRCHEADCKTVHCKVTPWNQWSACSVSCGEGKRIKQRKVLRAPSEDGKSCPELILSKSCKMPACLEENYELIEEDEQCIDSDGMHRSEGETWNPEECLTCQCTNHRKSCQLMYCPPIECDNPIKFPGFCCKLCG